MSNAGSLLHRSWPPDVRQASIKREDRTWCTISLVPVNVWHVSSPNHVVNKLPLAVYVVQQCYDSIVKSTSINGAFVDGAAIVGWPALRFLGRRQYERPTILHLEMINLENDRLFEFLFNWHA